MLCSCTIPHKEAIVDCCDEVDPTAKVLVISWFYNAFQLLFFYLFCIFTGINIAKYFDDLLYHMQLLGFLIILQLIGAVNCVVRRPDGKLFGCNTDYVGAISAIEEALQGQNHFISYKQTSFSEVRAS